MNDMININIEGLDDRTKVCINNDPNKVIELNLGDMNVLTRYKNSEVKIQNIANSFSTMNNNVADEDVINNTAKLVSDLDTQLREIVNYIFDYDVCTVLAGNGSMVDICNGELRFVKILNALLVLYGKNLTDTTSKVAPDVEQAVSKYID